MKNYLLFTLTLLFFITTNAQIPSGAVMEYTLDGGDLSNTVSTNMLVPSNTNASFVNDRIGNINNAVELNGTQYTGDSVTSVFELTTVFWIRSNGGVPGDSKGMLQFFGLANTGFRMSHVDEDRLYWAGAATQGVNPVQSRSVSMPNLFDNLWHQVVFRTSIFSNVTVPILQIDVFVDGIKIPGLTSNPFSAPLFFINSSGPLVIAPTNSKYENQIDDVYVYDRALTDTEISDFYQATRCQTCSQLIVNTTGTGTVIGDGSYVTGSTATLTATPPSNGVFLGWTGDVTSSNTSVNIVMDSDKIVNANFQTNPIYVDIDAVSGNNDGSSWANAYTNLQTAINAALADDTIWVAEGTYITASQTTGYIIPASKPGLKIYGGFNGTESLLTERDFNTYETIISGDINQDDTTDQFLNRNENSFNVFVVVGTRVVLDGLTISGGYAYGSSTPLRNGGAIRKTQTPSELYVRNCIIRDNFAFQGGAGIFCFFESPNNILEVTGCQFINNTSGWAAGIYGGSIALNPTVEMNISNNLFTGNETGDYAGQGYAGSAMWLRAIPASTVNTKIINNTIYGNRDKGTNSFAVHRTSVGIENEPGAIINTNFSNNISYENEDINGALTRPLSNVTSASIGTVTVKNSIADFGFTYLNPSNVSNTSTADPLFTDALNGDFTLTTNSPAIDFGENVEVLANTTLDLGGNPRINNGTVDAGAYEYITSGACIVNIPDSDFKLYLLSQSAINTNGDGEIQCDEAANFTGSIFISGNLWNISSFTGIEAFTNIESLGLNFFSNYTTIDLSQNINLEFLNLTSSANLSSIVLPVAPNLENLQMSGTNLGNIDVSNLASLRILVLGNSNLSSIDLSNNTALQFLSLKNNQLSNLDVSLLPNLTNVELQNNSLISLNLANTNNSGIANLNISFNPNLSCAQIDTGFTPPTNWIKDTTTVYSDNCSSLSLNELDDITFNLYPNPVSDVLYVNSNTNIKEVIIYSILGTKVYSKDAEEPINVTSLETGIYIIEFFDENGNTHRSKFIKN